MEEKKTTTHHGHNVHEAVQAEDKACCCKVCNIKNINPKTAKILGAIIIVLALIFVCKGLFIAAMINGSPVSRLSVIRELERNSGKEALESIIIERLINAEAVKNDINITDDEINAEIKKAEDQIKSQGGTLEQVLASQGMSLELLKRQIVVQKELEALLADKVQVTQEEINNFITENKIKVPKGEEDSYNAQIAEEIRQQKLNTESRTLIESLRSTKTIRYFVDYK